MSSPSSALHKSPFGSRYFPNDLWPITFSYLPRADLAQLRRVCKLWSRSAFIKKELLDYKIQRFRLSFCFFHHVMITHIFHIPEQLKLYQKMQLKKEQLLKIIKEDPMVAFKALPPPSLFKKIAIKITKIFGEKSPQTSPASSSANAAQNLNWSTYIDLREETSIGIGDLGNRILFQLSVAMHDRHVQDAVTHLTPPTGIQIVSLETSAKEFLKNLRKVDPNLIYINASLLRSKDFIEALREWLPFSHGVRFAFIASFPLLFKEKADVSHLPNFLKLLTTSYFHLTFTTFELEKGDILALAKWIKRTRGENNLILESSLSLSNQSLIKQSPETLKYLSDALRIRSAPFSLILLLSRNYQDLLDAWRDELDSIQQANPYVHVTTIQILPPQKVQFTPIVDRFYVDPIDISNAIQNLAVS
jgi:hypothetical protein